MQLNGLVRDFRQRTEMGGHVDFENMPPTGLGRYAGAIALEIGNDGKPVHQGGAKKIAQQWRDSANRQIAWCMQQQFPMPGDVIGQWGLASNAGITSAQSYSQWYHDTPVYNMSQPLTITLVQQPSGMYVFDDLTDPYYDPLNGFFPIDDQLFGNSPPGGGGGDHNFHFTYEIHAQFEYDAKAGQSFKFKGSNCDVWTFVDGRLVNDLIGVHAAHDQFIAMNRLGLEDGEWYSLDFFFAQRFRPTSHFRIETNILFESVLLETISAVFD